MTAGGTAKSMSADPHGEHVRGVGAPFLGIGPAPFNGRVEVEWGQGVILIGLCIGSGILHEMAGPDLDEMAGARPEVRWTQGAWRFPIVVAAPAMSLRRIGDGNGSQQLLRIRVPGAAEHGRAGADFDDFTLVHDGNPMADLLHHGHVVGDEEVGDAEARI